MAYIWDEDIESLIDKYPPHEIEPPSVIPPKIEPTPERNDIFTNWDPNPLRDIYGNNWFYDQFAKNYREITNRGSDLPLPKKVPGLVIFDDDDDLLNLEFLEQIHSSKRSAVFKVLFEGNLRALKVVSIDSVPLNRMLIPPGTLWSP
jgi:hypothetical protein